MKRPSHWEHLFRDAQIGLAYGSFTDYRFLFVNDAFAQQRGYARKS